MVAVCANAANANTLALVSAANQTGGKVVCILKSFQDLIVSKKILGKDSKHVKFVTGDAQNLISNHFREADFVLIDCNIENHENVLRAVEKSVKQRNSSGAVVVGYNAFKGSWRSGGLRTQLLPIGDGLLVTRLLVASPGSNCNGKRSHWIVKVDKCTGEEHVFRVRSPHGKQIEA